MNIEIKETTIETAFEVSRHVPELIDPHPPAEYHRRIANKSSLILVAYANGTAAGFKVGYDKAGDGSFYSWMGGVIPAYRHHHIAKMLAAYQEEWARAQGFKSVIFKTRNRHKAMLMFAISNDFSIMAVEPRDTVAEHRIILGKPL
jgi:predicted GNAT superfamily acetyltransferase